jgi:hypothetical protein
LVRRVERLKKWIVFKPPWNSPWHVNVADKKRGRRSWEAQRLRELVQL